MRDEDLRREEDELPVLTGRAWVFTDFLRADEIVPAEARDLAEAARSLFRPLDPAMPERVVRGDIIVGGSEFACGEGGVHAARALRRAGVAAVVARSFALEFAEEALVVGLPAIRIDETQMIRSGDRLRLDIEGRRLVNLSSGDRYPIREITEGEVAALRAGGSRVRDGQPRS